MGAGPGGAAVKEGNDTTPAPTDRKPQALLKRRCANPSRNLSTTELFKNSERKDESIMNAIAPAMDFSIEPARGPDQLVQKQPVAAQGARACVAQGGDADMELDSDSDRASKHDSE